MAIVNCISESVNLDSIQVGLLLDWLADRSYEAEVKKNKSQEAAFEEVLDFLNKLLSENGRK